MKVVSVNVRGLNFQAKRKTLFTWAEQQKIDVLCLQETFCTENKVKSFNDDWEGLVYHSVSDSTHSRGVSILFRKGLEFKVLNNHKSDDGRKVMVNIEIENQIICIISAYAPNIEQNRIAFFKRLFSWINQYSRNPHGLLLCGDFNTVMKSLDRNTNKIDKTTPHLINLISNLGLEDSFRFKNKDVIKYSYSNSQATALSRIDYIFNSKLMNGLINTMKLKIIPKIPDHKACILDISLNNNKGKGYWKLNATWLQDKTYITGITALILEVSEEYKELVDKRTVWDLIKIHIKEFSIKYAIQMNKIKSHNKNKLEKDIENYELKISTLIEKDRIKVVKLRNELKLVNEQQFIEESKGIQIRSRAKKICESDQNPHYFKFLEQKHQTNNTITCLKDEKDNIVNKTENLLKVTKNYYNNLFSSKAIQENCISNYLDNINIDHKLTPEEANLCENDISEEECYNVLQQHMKTNKSPGFDGIPVEFYKLFWNQIKGPLLESFKYALIKNELSFSHRECVITLMFKKGDRTDLKNYRPISLSNVDYKILAFVLSNRLHKILDKIISQEQTAYVRKRFIGENIRQLQDIIEYTSKFNIPGLVVFLDFEKAFDSLEWNFLFKTLEKFGFQKKFINWIKCIYSCPIALIKVNGFLTEHISISKGIRQGCPLSALLFIICTEILATAIKQNDDIKGIPVPFDRDKYKTIKLSQYADDICLYLKDIQQFLNALDTIMDFGNVSGLVLNLQKTEGLWLGNLANCNLQIGGINWPNVIRYLGVYIGKDVNECNKRNWDEKIITFQKLLDCWRLKNLTLYSKVNFIKTMAISKLTFSMQMLPAPFEILKKVEKLIFNFLWGKVDKIRRRSLICPMEEGGLNMLDCQSFFLSLKATWINRLSSNRAWTYLPKFYMDKIAPSHVLLTMSFEESIELTKIKLLPNFYQEVFLAYCKSNTPTPIESKICLYNQTIWGNRYFKHKNECLYSRNMIDAKFLYIKDVLNTNGCIKSSIYNELRNKNTYFKDITLISKIAKEFKTLINSDEDLDETHPSKIEYKHIDTKSKPFYMKMKNMKKLVPKSFSFWKRQLPNFTFNLFYFNKIKPMKVAKIKEFLFKIQHNICACGDNLFKWKINTVKKCIYCREEIQTIKHLLWDCNHANTFWTDLGVKLNIQFSYELLILGSQGDLNTNNTFSVLKYLIYKKFLVDNDKPQDTISLDLFIKRELEYKSVLFNLNTNTTDDIIPLRYIIEIL